MVDKCEKRFIDRTFDASIIEKIRKLRAITERRGATEGEALAAEQRMFRLLAKYNLEISQIPDDEPTERDTRIESESADRPSSVWKQFLYTAVANLNFSECFTWRQHIIVVGTRANRIATLEMASYLIETVERLANKEAAEVPGDERRHFRHSYAEGCATRIYGRLEQMRLEAQAGRMKAEDPNSLLPALADVYQTNRARVDDFIADHFGKVYRRTHYTRGGHDGGYILGYNAGGKVGLHRQLGREHRHLIALRERTIQPDYLVRADRYCDDSPRTSVRRVARRSPGGQKRLAHNEDFP